MPSAFLDMPCKCGHTRRWHDIEPPYDCLGSQCGLYPDESCHCQGFTLAAQSEKKGTSA
jgi:hypothetical protein